MGFRILVVPHSPAIYSALESAIESLAFSLVCAPADFLALPQDNLEAYISHEHINVVVHATVSQTPELQKFAAACSNHNVPLIHISSYRVFGANQQDLTEATVPEPDDSLGFDLFAAEQAVLAMPHSIVLRMPWTLLSYSENSIDEGLLTRTCIGLLNNTVLNVSEAASGSIVSWPEMAKTIVAMVQQILCGAENWGVFHVHSSDACSEAEFADAVARLLRSDGFCIADLAVNKNTFPGLVERTAVLRGRRCTDNFGIQQRSFRIGLKGAVKQWVANNGYVPALQPQADSSSR